MSSGRKNRSEQSEAKDSVAGRPKNASQARGVSSPLGYFKNIFSFLN